jgi:tetratricopeptide (TPR) repeat protein
MIQFDPETGSRFTVHRLVQTITRRRIPDADRKRWVEATLRLVDAYVPTEPPPQDVRSWGLWEPLQAHVEAIVGYADAEGLTDPTTRLMNDVAVYVQTRGLFDLPERFYRRALEIDEASFGPAHPGVAIDLNNLATLLQATNRLAEAEPLMRRALENDEASFGPAHPKVAIRLNNLAQLLKATNRLAEAEPLMRRALEIDEASFGPAHPNVAIRLNNLAQLLQDTNRLVGLQL